MASTMARGGRAIIGSPPTIVLNVVYKIPSTQVQPSNLEVGEEGWVEDWCPGCAGLRFPQTPDSEEALL